MKIAVIGTGVSGLGAAYLLHSGHGITVYEQAGRLGGHSRTIDAPVGGPGEEKTIPVDTGFIVFNGRNYPNLTGLFRELNVPFEKSDMSFGVSIGEGWLEYSSNHMLAQPVNIIRPAFWGMVFDILRFNRQAAAYLEKDAEITLGRCLDELNMKSWFRRYYLLAMGAAIWSSPVEAVMRFPARTFLQFFRNHGLLSINDHPQWYTVTGGSREYIKRLTAGFRDRIKLNCGVEKISTGGGKITLTDSLGGREVFDQAVLACHADQALRMIETPTSDEKDVLGCFGYQNNQIIVHKDDTFMPGNRKCWASWVYLSQASYGDNGDHEPAVSLSYWMNKLQNLDTSDPVIVTLNPGRRPREELIVDEHAFSHPVFDLKAVKAQQRIETIQGKRGLWFCGAYQRYGFHEDGLLSAVNVAENLGAQIPWR